MDLFVECPDCFGSGIIDAITEEICDLCDGEGIIESQYCDEV